MILIIAVIFIIILVYVANNKYDLGHKPTLKYSRDIGNSDGVSGTINIDADIVKPSADNTDMAKHVTNIDGVYKPRRKYLINPAEFRRSKYEIKPKQDNKSEVRFNEEVAVRFYNKAGLSGTTDAVIKINDAE